MAPSRSTAAVAQWVSLIPRTIIRDDDSSKHRADENPDVLGLADDQREGGGLDQERHGAGGGEGRRHSDALDQSAENDEEPCEGEQPEEEAPKHLDRGGRSLEVVGEHGQDGGVERKRRQKTGEPRTPARANAAPWSSARKKTMGPDVSGSPTNQPPTPCPQRRPATLAAPMRAGVRTSLRTRLSSED